MRAAGLAWLCCIVTETPKHNKHLGQLIRYAIVGLASNLAGYLIYLLLTALVLPPKLAMTLLYTTGALIGFFGNRRFTFRHQGSLARATLAYIIVHTVGWMMNYALLHTFSDQMGFPHQLVQAVAIFIVAAYLFVAMRYIVFPAKTDAKGPLI